MHTILPFKLMSMVIPLSCEISRYSIRCTVNISVISVELESIDSVLFVICISMTFYFWSSVCEQAYSMAQNLDPNSDGRGVLQFKTGLMSVIKVLVVIGEFWVIHWTGNFFVHLIFFPFFFQVTLKGLSSHLFMYFILPSSTAKTC